MSYSHIRSSLRRTASSGALIAALSLPFAASVMAHDHESGPAVMAAQAKPGQAAAAAAVGVKRTPAPADAYCYIGWPNDGETLHTRHIKVWFGTRNFGVAPASVETPNTGHHHLLIDTDLPPLDAEIPNDKNHLHFGAGQTETYIDLPPGTHTLQLLMGDANHVPHDPPVMSKKITIHVQ
jgi:hypothetical protein